MNPRILVVTSCTGEKRHKPENQLVLEDFKDLATLKHREEELKEYRCTAGKMYTGSQHLALMEGIQQYRKSGGEITLNILSAGYGLLSEDDEIAPYEVTFNTMDSQTIKRWSAHQNITGDLQNIAKNYDLLFFLLGDKYLQAIDWPLNLREDQTAIFFAGSSSKSRLLNWDHYHVLTIGEKEAKEFKYGLIGIKGYLFAQLLLRIAKDNDHSTWESIIKRPELIREYVLSMIPNNNRQLSLFDQNEGSREDLLQFLSEMYPVPKELIAKNFGVEPMFFLPENDDRVDPEYDFLTDFTKKDRNPLIHDVYSHEIYGRPQYDGMLVSKVNIDNSTQQKRVTMKELGMHAFYRLPESYPIMGDCGAFSYVGQEVPPYTTEEILEYYHELKFDYGVSIDHLIFGAFQRDETIRNQRYELTLRMAEEFINKYHEHKESRGYTFHPIGIVQGWDPKSFRDAVEHLICLGYDYIALGGLAREKSDKIYEILKAISPIIPNENFRMHLFGVARDMRTMHSFIKLGVTSFDSSSPLRRAWLGTGHNYHTPKKHYTAIRIPEAKETAGRVKKMMQEGKSDIPFAEYKRLEQEALTALREFSDGRQEMSAAVESILAYDKILGENRDMHEDMYTELLSDKPWEECQCVICKDIGIDVVVFRGNNRNRRRGFHNTHVYYKQVQDLRKSWKK
ncbi:queuine/other tRNA-ribosyltransferase [Paenibacillus sp. Marseille-P2973]|uniref:tRNA-guanine transglycosylase DpdA n=1 Tax=Paenibacillus sp. Marseille-P2973 TaxID=1871032 RepID=UPI001B394F9F|nr:tRNA-guanine transglycosylase DpdA [Paenibacillus sp. Marseille-P2973]MBQ4899865.1 queuine/other tRNA-ribosyltransferase [Paenibacillus sp. Marseille-P2973]